MEGQKSKTHDIHCMLLYCHRTLPSTHLSLQTKFFSTRVHSTQLVCKNQSQENQKRGKTLQKENAQCHDRSLREQRRTLQYRDTTHLQTESTLIVRESETKTRRPFRQVFSQQAHDFECGITSRMCIDSVQQLQDSVEPAAIHCSISLVSRLWSVRIWNL